MQQRSRQNGVALFISLVLLLVLTIAGVSAVQTTTLEERMARNSHDAMMAFQSAESALRQAETWMEANVNSTAIFNDAGTNGLWTAAEFDEDDRWTNAGVWSGAASVQVPVSVPDVAEQPRYIIEWLATVERTEGAAMLNSSYQSVSDRIEIFRVTARGVGGSANSQVVLQSTYGMIF
jgi:type IV pilus assembly protein PilX